MLEFVLHVCRSQGKWTRPGGEEAGRQDSRKESAGASRLGSIIHVALRVLYYMLSCTYIIKLYTPSNKHFYLLQLL